MNDTLWLGQDSFELRIVPWKHDELFFPPVKVLKVCCVDFKSDVDKAPFCLFVFQMGD